MKELADIVREFERRSAEPMALATLVRAHGSTYRRPGARMLITASGRTVGFFSGGCLEEEIAQRASAVMASHPCLFTLDTRLRFGCNGSIEIFIEPIHRASSFLTAADHCLRTRQPFTAVTIFHSADEGQFALGTHVIEANSPFSDLFLANNDPALAERERTGDVSNEVCSALIQHLEPPIRLIAFGTGPESEAMEAFCRALGWEFIESDESLEFVPDERTAVIVKTHNYGRDFKFLEQLSSLELPYIGLLGSKRRRDRLHCDLLDHGLSPNCLKNLFGPAGLELGAESPQEIALAIIAEIQSVFCEGSGKSLRDHRGPIHSRVNQTASIGVPASCPALER